MSKARAVHSTGGTKLIPCTQLLQRISNAIIHKVLITVILNTRSKSVINIIDCSPYILQYAFD